MTKVELLHRKSLLVKFRMSLKPYDSAVLPTEKVRSSPKQSGGAKHPLEPIIPTYQDRSLSD